MEEEGCRGTMIMEIVEGKESDGVEKERARGRQAALLICVFHLSIC